MDKSDELIKDLLKVEELNLLLRISDTIKSLSDLHNKHDKEETDSSKVLEQEPCEDYVSKINVKEQMLKYGFHAPDMTVTEFVEDCLPSVAPQSKVGRMVSWYEHVETEYCIANIPHCKCSECNQEYDPHIALLFNYCPNCGTKMEVESE